MDDRSVPLRSFVLFSLISPIFGAGIEDHEHTSSSSTRGSATLLSLARDGCTVTRSVIRHRFAQHRRIGHRAHVRFVMSRVADLWNTI